MPRIPVRPGLALSLAARSLVRDRGPTAVSISILALGLAAPATFFSFLVGATRPLPVPEGRRVVRVEVVSPSQAGRALPVTSSDLELLRGSGGLQALGGFRLFEGTVADPERAAARFSGALLTGDVLPLLRVAPALGRIPTADEAATTVLLGHDLWQELYEGDPGALGRPVQVNGAFRTVVGVLPEGFGFPFKQNAWVLAEPGLEGALELVGRLAPGATYESASAELGARWLRGDPLRAPDRTGGVVRVRPYTGGRGESGEAVAFGGLVLVGVCLLLIACANVANLLLVRATERVRALGVQAALGAGRAQISAQLLLEALLVAAGGGALGLLLASAAVDVVQKTLSEEHFGYFWMRMAVDGPVLLFVGLLVVGTALIAGMLPAIRIAGLDVQRVLREQGAGAATIGGGGAWSRAFVTLQLALSCGALVAAGLTGRALAGSRDLGRSLPVDQIVIASVDPRSPPTGAVAEGRLAALEEGLASLPEVASAALVSGMPGYGERSSRLEVEGRPTPGGVEGRVMWSGVTPSFFATLDLEILAGRGIQSADVSGAEGVAVVSEDFVARHSPDAPALGRRIRLASADSTAWFTVVGVVEDTRLGGSSESRADRVYLALAQLPPSEIFAVVRGRGGVAGLPSGLRRSVAAVSADMPVWDLRTLAGAYAYMVRVPRALATMAVTGGIAGLLVAAVGLYGLLAFRVRQRRRELGIRLAVGADGARLAREVLVLALRQLAPAVVVGLGIAWMASPVLSAMLFGLDPRSPAVYAGVALAFVGTGLLAALLPALRAAAVAPAQVLRGE